ncbi:MAG: substrate-binding domain-containing protein [Gammaproteobacteria bacterium]|nr:substrate-binding domain-containing protein [Gammaproteobacteria bacterium]
MKKCKLAYAVQFRSIFIFALLFHTNAIADHHVNFDASAPKFSNPEQLSEVPEDWHNRPFKYDDVDKDADLVLALGQQSYPVFHKLIHQYAAENKLKIIVKPGTCGITSGRLLKKAVDIGAFCCPPGKSDRLPGLEFHSLGISPIALIVHQDNPLKNLSSEEARQIFQGQSSKWNQLNSPDTKNFTHVIKPVARLHCKIRPGHWRGLLQNEDQFSPRLFEVGVIADMISQVAHNTGAIGWEVPLMVSYHNNKGVVRMLKIDGHEATDMNYVLSGKYPLYRSYSLTTWSDQTHKNKNHQEARKLVKYLQQHIEKVHPEISFIPPSQLRKAGWKFKDDELIGEPDKK